MTLIWEHISRSSTWKKVIMIDYNDTIDGLYGNSIHLKRSKGFSREGNKCLFSVRTSAHVWTSRPAQTHKQIPLSSTHTRLWKTNDSPRTPLFTHTHTHTHTRTHAFTHTPLCAINPVRVSRGKLYQTTEFTWPGESAFLNPTVSPNWAVGDWSSMPSVCVCVYVCVRPRWPLAEVH